MDVFMRNLPPDLTDRALEKLMQPFMEKLSIKDYLCEKQRKKTIAFLTFLHERDGEKFLQHHGEEPLPDQSTLSTSMSGFGLSGYPRSLAPKHPPSRARLSLTGRQIFCKVSNRKPQQFALTLKAIKHEVNQRQNRVDSEPGPTEAARTLHASELHCGYHTFVGGTLTFTAEWTANEVSIVKFTKRNLSIKLTQRNVQLIIPFQSIIELVWWPDGSAAVTLSLPPTFLSSETGADDIVTLLAAMFSNPRAEILKRTRVPSIEPEHGVVSGFCLVYYFKVPSHVVGHVNADFRDEMLRIRNRQLFPVTHYQLGFRRASAAPGLGLYISASKSLKLQLEAYNRAGTLPFDLLFLLQALMANGYLHPSTISALAKKLAGLFVTANNAGNGQRPVSVDAFKKLFEWIDYPSPYVDPKMFEVDEIMEYLEEAERLVKEGYTVRSELFNDTQNHARIFRAVVTPARITLHGPELEAKNRVLRKYPDHVDHFLRVQFCDENGQDLFFNAKISLDAVYDRFKAVLGNGIMIAGRVYRFLGFSHSSLRAHSLWLSAPFVYQGQLQLPESIITNLGKFEKIKSPARRAARIGQAFSETPFSVSLDANGIQVIKIQDVERNGRVFSDGVGTISLGAAEAIYEVLPESKGLPTCFQIRWAGAKGMLSVDPSLEGNTICVRPSMLKFESDDKANLEICDMASKPIPMVLNRQLIKILEDMGAHSNWFLELQDRELRRLRGITASVYNTCSFLKTQSICESIQLPKFLRQTEMMGIDYRTDRFLRSAIEAILLKELRLLKHKARIPVRKGMTLFGIMDVTGYLKEGQVYVTYDTMQGRHCEPPGDGPVLVSRSPALYPGDVQLAHNIVPPDGNPLLRQRNCVVFSKWGDRDLPSKLSGGDLDGDVFHIIWDPDVVRPGTLMTFEPADYPRVSPLELDRPVTASDMAAFFVDFIQMDNLGVIATRHMILADLQVKGTLAEECKKLAELHSSAVDFSKTGRAVTLLELPKGGRLRPEFLAQGPSVTIHDKTSAIEMDKYMARQDYDDDEDNDEGPRHQFYESNRILGRLYRGVDEERIWAKDIKMKASTKGPSFWDQLVAAIQERVSAIGPVEWEHRSAEAQRIRHAYEDAIYGVMVDCADHPHQPLKELEVFTSRQRDRSTKLKDEFERITTWITREMRNPTSVSGYTSELDALELCLACVHIGWRKQSRKADGGHRSSTQGIESFKVVAAAALIRELIMLEKGMAAGRAGGRGGGYVGVSGRSK
ncbi:RNA-dependent RNA polymerase 1 [Madurella mycetomatis]|uniref:RNA-dependent RNA polymerase n=1 Tax=Madurella mycetomatis TaxID=100816 RepID=A0A175VUN6_9PEZI|nr:RNA-dependent RNA polymerase 1 [Madurella mycetomatis]